MATWGAIGSPAAQADVMSVSVNPTSVFGTDTSNGTVVLDAGIGGRTRTVELSSNNPAVAAVPSSVNTTFREPNEASFVVTTSPVAAATNVTITATEGGVSRQTVLTVLPPALTSISFSPDPVRGGENSIATIRLNRPAPSTSWLCSIQGPYPPTYFVTGSIVSFTPGATSTTKTINTLTVTTPVNALITVRPPTGQSPSVSDTLEVVPTRVESMTLSPASVTGGAASLGCVTMNGPASAAGASVALESSDPIVASVPATLPISFGDDDGCFLIQSHAVEGCASAVISATFGGQTVEATLNVGVTEQITENADNDRWGSRHPSTVGGSVLWTNGDDVLFDDGTGLELVQARGALDAVAETVFALGTGAAPGEVIGVWRRGTDFAWVWRSGGSPLPVQAVNPIDPKQAMNPEAVAISDGAVFMAWQAFFNANSVKHVFRVDPATGLATNMTGDAAVPGAQRVTTDGGQAAWLYVDSANPKLHFYDGSTVQVVDSGPINEVSPRLARGRLVYEKSVGGISHLFLFESTVPGAGPSQLSPATDAAHGHFAPATDGYHVAWLFGNANRSDLHILLNGGMALNDPLQESQAVVGSGEFPLQLQRGQLMWTDIQTGLFHATGGAIDPICVIPASGFQRPWLADGYIAGFGPVLSSPEPDNEVFIYPAVTPDDADLPMPPMQLLATAANGSVFLEWDAILGASSYNVYGAEEPRVTKDNFGSLAGGRTVPGILSRSARICALDNGTEYHFVVTTVEAGDEGGESVEASATPDANWVAGPGEVTAFLNCLAGPGVVTPPSGCGAVDFARADYACDGDVDLRDFAAVSNAVGP